MTTYRADTLLQLDVPKFGSRTESVTINPKLIEVKWSKNNHLTADEITFVLGYREGGVDPRAIKNARCSFWLWDANREDLDLKKHLRFTGIMTKATRKLSESGWVVDMTFQDYTCLFISNKRMCTEGMPNYSDTLRQVWERICDNTGWIDPDTGKIVSSVEALQDNLVFTDPSLETRTLGSMAPKRFHAIGKPQPKQGASSWDVWQWCVGSLGLISYIDKDTCYVTDTTEHYKKEDAARAIYGENIHSLEENVDTEFAGKGILLKSQNPLTGQVIEAFYPPPGDPRLKTRRSAVGKKSEGGATVTANETSADYDEFNRYDITDQSALDRCAKQAYEERSRQEIEGSFKTAEMVLKNKPGDTIDIFDLKAGDAIAIEVDKAVLDGLLKLGGDLGAQLLYLVNACGYDEDLALLIIKNIDDDVLRDSYYHVKSIELDYGPERFEVTIFFHNVIETDT